MYRVAASSMILLAFIAPATAVEWPAADGVLPPAVAGAVMRPSVHPAEPFVQQASLTPAEAEPVRPEPNLTARMAMAPKVIARVDISDQTMEVVVDGTVVHTWDVSTGGKGYRTPVGVWQPYRMHTMWRSRKYDNAPMPHSIFFTGGYAIHATPHIRRLGRPASHGCVRLHPDNAKALFALVKEYGRARTRVVIEN
jgi:lipoprotein-anchoring transpeptidase ErfK/SrfK